MKTESIWLSRDDDEYQNVLLGGVMIAEQWHGRPFPTGEEPIKFVDEVGSCLEEYTLGQLRERFGVEIKPGQVIEIKATYEEVRRETYT